VGTGERSSAWRRLGWGPRRLASSAVGVGALTNLTNLAGFFENPIHREILSLLEEVRLKINPNDAEQVATLEHLRRLPHLRHLSLTCLYPALAQGPFPRHQAGRAHGAAGSRAALHATGERRHA
jgi:hypothetical protein